MPTITVCSQVFGGLQDSPEILPVLLNLLPQRLSVAELIQRSVEAQVHDLLVQRQMNAQQVRYILDRQYLTGSEIAAQAQQGVVRYPAKPNHVPQIDVKAEVDKALRAFEAGSYIVLVNTHQVKNLKEEITFSQNTKVTFLRLMPLVGG